MSSRSRMASYRSSTDIDKREAEKLWATLQRAIREIFNSNEGTLSFEELYRSAYHLVLHKFGGFLYTNVEKEITLHLETVSKSLKATDDSLFLRKLVDSWIFYRFRVSMIADVLMYMDRNYIAPSGDTENVFGLGKLLFSRNIIMENAIGPRLKLLVLQEIKKDRDGKVANKADLKKVLRILIEVGINDRKVYQTEFETGFLKETASYYEEEAAQNIKRLTCGKYLEGVEQRVNQEKERCGTYLDTSTKEPLLQVLQEELIEKYYEDIICSETGCRKMFEDHAVDDLSRVYSLMKNVEKGMKLASDEFSNFILFSGGKIVSEHEDEKMALKLLNALLSAKDRFDEIVEISFKKDVVFQRALNNAMDKVVNQNVSTPHYLALFVDDIMKAKAKGKLDNISMKSLEETFGKVLSIFKHLQSRDLFEDYYKQLLAKRLLAKKKDFSVDIAFESERIMIKKLKAEIGQGFTTKLENMLNDLSKSNEETREFNASEASQHELDVEEFAVTVLTREMWPYQSTGSDTIIPEYLHQSLLQNYADWYVGKHDGRKIEWLLYLGYAEMEATFKDRTYKLIVTTYQMLILHLFSDGTEISFTDIANATKIPLEKLKRHLISLTAPRYKLLLKKPKGKNIANSDIFSINEDFYSKYDRVKIPLVSSRSRVKNKENAEQIVPGNVVEDRKQLIDAAIVRILKTRKVVTHNQLMAETVKHLSHRFRPAPSDIKTRIESLIDREYLERDEEDNKKYVYVA